MTGKWPDLFPAWAASLCSAQKLQPAQLHHPHTAEMPDEEHGSVSQRFSQRFRISSQRQICEQCSSHKPSQFVCMCACIKRGRGGGGGMVTHRSQ